MVKQKESPAAISSPALRRIKDIVWLDPNQCIDYPLNNKHHPPEQIARLAGQIQKWGWDVPIVVDENRVLLKGHGRKLAALQLGLTEVPVLVRDDLSEIDKKAMRIADNQVATLGEINLENINLELTELKDLGIDLDSLGFSKADLDKLTADLGSVATGEEPSSGAEDKPLRFNVTYNIIFDDELQQQAWFRFIKHLNKTYPQYDTVAQRLFEYIEQAGI